MAADLDNGDKKLGDVIKFGPTDGAGIPSVAGKIQALTDTVKYVVSVFKGERRNMLIMVLLFSGISIAIIVTIYLFYAGILKGNLKPDFKDKTTFEISYDIGIRAIVISILISLLAFCLKMMRIYLSFYGQIRHKIAVLNSLPVLVNANEDAELSKSTYSKIVGMLIEARKETPIGNEEEIKVTIIDVLKELLKKKE